jgi:hypothetical protein
MSTTSATSLKRHISRILKAFTKPDTPELLGFVSGVNDYSEQGSIDDGSYGDPLRDERPDFVQKDRAGWHEFRR